jgi:serine/threonine-protein kinase mTOR
VKQSQNLSDSPSAFFRSIALSEGDSLQDTLRLLTLWFSYGFESFVDSAMRAGFTTVKVDVWLEVIPQVCEVA